MDPTRQRRQTPLKAALDDFVKGTATYLIPTVSSFAYMTAMLLRDAPLAVVVVFGCIYYWAVHHEAATTYFQQVALPRAFDLSLDPTPSQYFHIVFYRSLIGLALPTLVLALPSQTHSLIAATAGAIGIVMGLCVRQFVYEQLYGIPYLQAGSLGNRLKPVRYLRRKIEATISSGDLQIPWGGLRLPMAELLKNFLIIGSVGSGKTLLLKSFLTAMLPLVGRYSKWRAVIVDPKAEFAGTIQSLVPRYKLAVLNPGDARTSAWAVSRDLRYEKHFHEAAHIIIPSIDESQPFFTDGAEALLQSTMTALAIQAPNDWQFSDVFIGLRSLKRLETLLKLHPETRDTYEAYVPNQRVWLDLYATLLAKVADFYPVAAVFSHVQHEHPTRSVSLADFVEGNSVLLLSMQTSAETSQGRFLAILIKRLSQLLLDQPTGQSALDYQASRRTVIVIDEAPRAGKIELLNLVTNGRDYGVGILAAMQSIDAMREHYPQDRWNALANEFHSMALLSTNSPTSLKWMADQLGNIDSHLPPSDKPRPADTEGEWAPVLNPTQFHTLCRDKKVGPNCVPGVFLNSQYGAWYSDEGVTIAEPLPSVRSRAPIPEHWNELRSWDHEDLNRLNLTHLRDELDLHARTGGTPRQPIPPTPPRTRPPQTTRLHYPRFRP